MIQPNLPASNSTAFRVRAAELWFRNIGLRLPFRFGKAVMTELPVATLALTMESANGTVFQGWTASGLPPMWFDKRDGRTLDANIADLILSIRRACEVGIDIGTTTPMRLHVEMTAETRRRLHQESTPMPPLAAGFGPSLVEAALVDGLCRLQAKPFHALLRADALGFGARLRDLPAMPSPHMHFRHTVGMADPLRADDLAPGERLSDGLPQALDEVIATYRPRYFKVKIGGGDDATHERLQALARLLDAQAGDYRLTLDGNEQWDHAAGFLDLWRRLRADASLQGFLGRILYVEQPVRREKALLPEAGPSLRELAQHVALLMDESDGESGDAEMALALGYTGISVKMCKSLFRAVHHYNLIAERRSQGLPGFLSSEDLTTVPCLPLQQDLALAAALGLTHSERNGHHFSKGGLFLSERESAEALKALPSLYEKGPDGVLRLRIVDGTLDLGEVHAQGFGGLLIPETKHQQPIFSMAP
jgi:hypothetical protein